MSDNPRVMIEALPDGGYVVSTPYHGVNWKPVCAVEKTDSEDEQDDEALLGVILRYLHGGAQ